VLLYLRRFTEFSIVKNNHETVEIKQIVDFPRF